MLKIYGRNNSLNVQKVLWGCHELNVPFERIDWGGPFGGNRDPAYLAMNPNAVVPTIVDGDFVLWESNTCLRYLANKHDDGTLYPKDPERRAAGEKWMDWQLSTAAAAMVPVFQPLIRHKPEQRDMAAIAAGRDRWAEVMSRLDTALGRSAYVSGASFTICDIPVGIISYRWFELPIERENQPNLKRWYDALSQRPGFKKHIAIGLS